MERELDPHSNVQRVESRLLHSNTGLGMFVLYKSCLTSPTCCYDLLPDYDICSYVVGPFSASTSYSSPQGGEYIAANVQHSLQGHNLQVYHTENHFNVFPHPAAQQGLRRQSSRLLSDGTERLVPAA